MIIINLLVANKEQGDAVTDLVLKNKFSLTVFGNVYDSYHLSSAGRTVHTKTYVIQFVTKSMLFSEIEASLRNEFPETDFYICATPIVHMVINLHNKIKQRVIGLKLIEPEIE